MLFMKYRVPEKVVEERDFLAADSLPKNPQRLRLDGVEARGPELHLVSHVEAGT